MRDERRAYGRACTAPVFDHDLLAPRFAQFLREQTRDNIVAAARRIGHDQANRLDRIFLRPCRMGADDGAQRQNKIADETYRSHPERAPSAIFLRVANSHYCNGLANFAPVVSGVIGYIQK
jgi:hypothetical protein